MPDAAQIPPSDPGLRASLIRQLGGGALLVVLVAGVFWAIGTVGEPDDSDLAVDPVDAVDDVGDQDGGAADDLEPQPPTDDATDGDVSDGAVGADDAGEDDSQDPDDAQDPDDSQDSDDSQDEDEPDDAGTDDPPEPDEPSIDPSTISVQVLDGYQSDGGAAANAVAEHLRAAGYNLIAQNPALRYEVTTVLWTAGHEAEARQVAAEVGAPEARQQSGNLSSQVAVHVVVGSDRG